MKITEEGLHGIRCTQSKDMKSKMGKRWYDKKNFTLRDQTRRVLSKEALIK
jgi:hypothetical protein